MNRLGSIAATAAVCIIFSTAAPIAAEDARQIFETAMERYEKRVASIESLTIVQEVMGIESTTRLKKIMDEDGPTLISSGSGAGRAGDLGSVYEHLDTMANNATVEGTEDVDGHPCWVVSVKDLGGMHMSGEGVSGFESSDGTLYIDKKDLVVRRMEMNGVAMRSGTKQPVTMEMHLKDYREVDGWLHPFRTEISLGGEGGGEPPEVAEMRKAMAMMKEELAKMPAQQREQMEKMLKGRMPEFAGEDGSMKIDVIVKQIRVNEPA